MHNLNVEFAIFFVIASLFFISVLIKKHLRAMSLDFDFIE